MRLINVHDLSMKEFYGHNIPAYTILSHTWGDDEVLLSDMKSKKKHKAYKRRGFAKIEFCCKQAKQDGWDWAWVDTCCIDKRSSAELSEAINSMFQWYSRAMICYAYLIDVELPGDGSKEDDGEQSLFHLIGQSRWFKRGWTLQELIAPIEVEFFDKNWEFLGSKSSWTSFLQVTTRIPREVLRNAAAIREIPVGLRMNWAFDRETTREEDMAYCLLGIFDINMPLLYGEGPKAFMRLQEEIMKHQDDHTLFLWDLPSHSGSELVSDYNGLLARSPRSFSTCPGMNTRKIPPESPWPLVSNRGVQIRFHLKAVPQESWMRFGLEAPVEEDGLANPLSPRSVQLAALCCQLEATSMKKLLPFGPAEGESVVAMVLWQPREVGPGVFYRKPALYVRVSIDEVSRSWKLTSCLIRNAPRLEAHTCNYRGLSISKGDCETRLVECHEVGSVREYLLSTSHTKGVLHTVIRLNCCFMFHQFTGRLQAGRLPAWPSDEATAKKRFRLGGAAMELATEEVKVTRPGLGPVVRKVWVFGDESLELVLILFNEGHEGGGGRAGGATLPAIATKLVVTFRPIRQ